MRVAVSIVQRSRNFPAVSCPRFAKKSGTCALQVGSKKTGEVKTAAEAGHAGVSFLQFKEAEKEQEVCFGGVSFQQFKECRV